MPLLGRAQKIVWFQPFTTKHLIKIVRREAARLRWEGINIRLTKDLTHQVLAKTDPHLGVRGIRYALLSIHQEKYF